MLSEVFRRLIQIRLTRKIALDINYYLRSIYRYVKLLTCILLVNHCNFLKTNFRENPHLSNNMSREKLCP